MNIIIKDEQGLGTALLMEGYSQAEIQEAKRIVRNQFVAAVNKVHAGILGGQLPEIIVVDMAQNDNAELSGDKSAKLASFNSELSRSNRLIFTICEKTIKIVMKENDNGLFKATVIHEVLHSADQPILRKNRRLFARLLNEIYAKSSDFFAQTEIGFKVALLDVLQMFDHYRAEGIAILGEHLLVKRRLESVNDPLGCFRWVFELTMLKSKNIAMSGKAKMDTFDDDVFQLAYMVAPSVLLLVIARLGKVENELAVRAMRSLNDGDFAITDEEAERIIRASMSLSLSDYIQGVVSLGDEVVPAKQFLELCAVLQQDWDDRNVKVFSELLDQPNVVSVFNVAMAQIMGCVMPEDEIAACYKVMNEKHNEDAMSVDLRKKADQLYGVMKNDSDVEHKRIAQWALTYLFDDQDVIHDDVDAIGYVDDAIIMDYALDIIGHGNV